MGENYSLNLRAKNMNELVDKIIEWQTWENNVEALPKKVQKNWYFFKKKRKKIRGKIDSDWQTYYGSNDQLNKDILELGKENFTREILYLCSNKGTMSYLEAREQFAHRVLENPNEWYNGIIQCKIHRSHVKL